MLTAVTIGNRVLGKKVKTVLQSFRKEEEQQMTEEAKDEPSGIWPTKLVWAKSASFCTHLHTWQ